MSVAMTHDMSLAGPIIIPGLAALVVLLMDLLPGAKKFDGSFLLAGFGALLSAVYTALFLHGGQQGLAFAAQLDVDRVALICTLIVHVAAFLAILLSKLYVERRRGVEQPEYYALILSSASGMAMLAAANDLVCVFLGIELLSIPLYVLCAIRRGRERSIEAGFKYLLMGAFASAFLLFGIGLWFGASGTTALSALAPEIERLGTGGGLAAFGATMFLIGALFKVGAVPFHMWTPDVYEGAPTPITAFMATATKAAVFAALLRAVPVLAASYGSEKGAMVVGGVAIATMFVGNLGALRQDNLKRLLAWSSIAHAGYLLVGIAAAIALVGSEQAYGTARSAVLYYLAVYAAMNLGAFAVALVLDRGADREAVSELAGLGRERPLLALAMAVFALALAGIPPTAGFIGKLYLFDAAIEARLFGLAVAGVLASVIGLFYYLRLLLVMYAQKPAAPSLAARGDVLLALTSAATLAVTLGLGILPGWFVDYVATAVRGY